MNQGFSSIPFKSESEHGLTSVTGVAKFSPAGVIVEFESKLLGLIGSGIKEARLALPDILDVKFRKGLFKVGAKIEIRTRSLAALEGLPSKNGRLILKLVRDDFDQGKAAVEQLQKELAKFQAELPPPHTPLSQLFLEDSEDETRELDR
ncbi:MAG: hypothetical protein QUS14_09940 [Pyrinomonadaceae bacterium]|nr:hypothetical protein [Pyrinomonadaceae bacterium]